MEKVVLTQEQADEIEIQKKEFRTSDVVVRRILTENMYTNRHEVFHSMTIDDVIRALYIGYEVEKNFEVGDWVVVDGYSEDYDGKILEITEIYKGALNLRYCKFSPSTDGGHNFCLDSVTDIRHATPEEIEGEKERRWWKKHGRDVWELKINDIVHSKVTKTYDEVVFVFRNGSVNLKSTTPNDFNQYHVDTIPKREIKNHNFEVICFASDRKDVKE